MIFTHGLWEILDFFIQSSSLLIFAINLLLHHFCNHHYPLWFSFHFCDEYSWKYSKIFIKLPVIFKLITGCPIAPNTLALMLNSAWDYSVLSFNNTNEICSLKFEKKKKLNIDIITSFHFTKFLTISLKYFWSKYHHNHIITYMILNTILEYWARNGK